MFVSNLIPLSLLLGLVLVGMYLCCIFSILKSRKAKSNKRVVFLLSKILIWILPIISILLWILVQNEPMAHWGRGMVLLLIFLPYNLIILPILTISFYFLARHASDKK